MKNEITALKAGDEVIRIAHSNESRYSSRVHREVVARVGRTYLYLVGSERAYARADGREKSDWPAFLRTPGFHEYETKREDLALRLEAAVRGYHWHHGLSLSKMERLVAVFESPE